MANASDVVNLQRVDEASAIAAPDPIAAGTWMERGFGKLAAEQEHLWPAEGEQASRVHAATAVGLNSAAETEQFLLSESASLVTASKESYQHCQKTLLPWVHRGPHHNLRYWVGWTVLGLGDAVGVAGAAILLGEEIWIAVGQAMATGLAAVTAGSAGHDLKEVRMARQRRRDPDDLTEDEKRYRRFFDDTSAGDSLLRVVAWLAGAIVVLIAAGIFALRASIEGGLAGLVFGALAAATALASFFNSYSHADEVADLIAVALRDFRQAVRRYRRMGRAAPLRRRARAHEMVKSITEEHRLRGEAAAHHVQALKFQSLTANPGVVGHGPATNNQGAAPAGQTTPPAKDSR
ncbi:hypothetical protein [Arthrobacter sp. 2MCAF14]|uniref:hypothetical protein n=1 Tax=Arthrobacter sp. 2MCAF14 TaxID=3232982 RepID=UPI003F93BB22